MKQVIPGNQPAVRVIDTQRMRLSGLVILMVLFTSFTAFTAEGDFRITSVRLADDGETVALKFSAEGGEQTFDVPTAGLGGPHFFRVTAENSETGTTFRLETSPSLLADTWTDAEVTAAPSGFALIPAGSFQMGDAFAEGDSDERPVHSVTVSAFYMARTETTWAQWQSTYNWAVVNGYAFDNTGQGKGANHPVHTVSWYDMVKWCNARSQKDGLVPCYTVGGATYKTGRNSGVVCNWAASGYRLPTEAEWEKAARGGIAGKRFPWGDTINHSRANYRADGDYPYDDSPFTDWRYHPTYNDGTFPYSSPVGSFAANGYGLYDMAGNMWEWCWDWYASYGSGAQTDPRGASSGASRLLRGGSWNDYANNCRSASRGLNFPTIRVSGIGFRLARSSVPQ